MSIEAEKLNNPTHFALHSKMQRKINTVKSQIDTKNEELQELIKERNKEQNKAKQEVIFN